MSFEDAFLESRSRFVEAIQVINELPDDDDQDLRGVPAPQKAMRGLTLVAIYAAVERSVNVFVEQAIDEIGEHGASISDCAPEIQSLAFHPRMNSIRDCSSEKFFDNCFQLFSKISERNVVHIEINPFLTRLQNVDGDTMLSTASWLGVRGYEMSASARGRLNNLRERRNAVAHGRESPATAGERFRVSALREMYQVANSEADRFGTLLRSHFEQRRYISGAA